MNMSHESHRKIHNELREHSPRGVKKAKKIFSFKYPKLFLFVLLIILSFYIFSQPFIPEIINLLGNFSYIGIFIAGVLMSLGFSTPLGIGLLINIAPQNILFGALLGGLGAVIADLLIFKTIKWSFMNEFKELEKTKGIRHIEQIVKKNKHVLIRHYLLYIFAGLVFATPLPDEIGISMLAGLTTIKPMKLLMISFFVHSTAIFLLLYFF